MLHCDEQISLLLEKIKISNKILSITIENKKIE